jgi:hypothetical protein
VCSEEVLQAIGPFYDEFRHLIPGHPNDSVRELCLSKLCVNGALKKSGVAGRYLPASGEISSLECIRIAEPQWRKDAVYYLKLDGSHGLSENAKSRVIRVASGAVLPERVKFFLQHYSMLMWQQEVTGMQVGVSLWRYKGEIRAENMVLGLHLYPWFAGNMSLRRSWWHRALLDDAIEKVHALNWSGVAMMEYIWEPTTDRFWFIEMNPRFWGYLHLDLSCGKDFPKLQIDAHFGRDALDLGAPTVTRVMRYAPGEFIHLASYALAKEVSVFQKLRRLTEVLLASFNPAVKADLWFKGDRTLYYLGWIRFFRSVPKRLSRALQHKNRIVDDNGTSIE